jgi:nitrogen fixation/metabolism regulation signal transduction histidine kinase
MRKRLAASDRRHRLLLAGLSVSGAAATAGLCALLPLGWQLRTLLGILAALGWALAALAARESVVEPLRGLTSVIEALRSGDYAIRGRGAGRGDVVGELVLEVNQLADQLRSERLDLVEATALLEQLLARIDAAVLAFDGRGTVRLANPAALRLLEAPAAEVLGRPAAELGLLELMPDEPGTRVLDAFAGKPGRWQVTHGTYREAGMAQHLLVVTDLRRALRDEERAAWQRLLRVMGHEVKNSLAPIRSIAGTVRGMVGRSLPEGAQRADALEGLRVIEERSASLDRFLAQYRKLAHLPQPHLVRESLAPLLRRAAALASLPVAVRVDEALSAMIDADLLEQALVNLLRNAAEAAGPAGAVEVEAAPDGGGGVTVRILDDGPGIQNPDNLFVPFFTTKPGGSGIGLVLSRQIAELHGGTLTLENQSVGKGAVATLTIPPIGSSR